MTTRRVAIAWGLAILGLSGMVGGVLHVNHVRSLRKVDLRWWEDHPIRRGEIRVRVNGPDGLPVPRGWIRIAHLESTGGGGGLGTFHGVASKSLAPKSPESTLWIEFLRPCDRDGTPLPFGAVVRERVPWEPREITLILPPESSIEGITLDREGRPLPSVRVRARPAYPPEVAGLFQESEVEPDPAGFNARGEDRGDGHSEARSGPDGKFRLGRLGKMDYLLFADFSGGLPPAEPVRASAGATGVTIQAGANPSPVVTVTDEAGRPVAGAWVTAEEATMDRGSPHPVRPFGEVASGQTDSRGQIALRGLDRSRKYTLEVVPDPAFRGVGRHGPIPPGVRGAVRNEWTPTAETIALPGMK